MRQYLVSGGAGFIGSHLVCALLEQGHRVRVLDDFSSGKRQNLEEPLDLSKRSGHLEIIEGDVRDTATVARAVRGVEIIFHEAAFVSVPESMEKPQDCFDVNILGTSALLEAARMEGVHRAVIASSAAVYGDSETLPLTEAATLKPLSPYAVSKRVDEMLAELYTHSLGLEVAALRYFNVYGPRQRPDSAYAAAVPIFIKRLIDQQPITVFGDGSQTRDLIYVGDVVRMNLVAAEHPAAAGEVFNVCTGQETRIIDLINTLLEIFPGASRPDFSSPRTGDIYKSLGSPAKAEKIVGFRAGTSLSDGLRATVEFMR